MATAVGIFRAAAPTVAAFSLTVGALLSPALELPEHMDETGYAWTAAYYGGKLARLDLRPTGSDAYVDPGWFPYSVPALTQPMGSRFIYALALAVARAPTPALPYSYTDPKLQGPETRLVPSTLLIVRIAAVLCAALGFALFALRLGWRGTAVAALILVIPHAREDLARGWAEGPLLLGLGLCVVAYGSRWFAPACGLAATFKLTALGLWPLLLSSGRKLMADHESLSS